MRVARGREVARLAVLSRRSRRWPSSSRRSTRSRCTWRCRSGSSGAPAQGRWALVGAARRRWPARRAARGSCCCCPLLMLYLYGPREDRAPDFARGRAGPARAALSAAQGRPVAGALPAGLGALHGLPGALGRRRADALSRPGRVGQALRRALSSASGTALKAAFEGARQLLSFQRHHVYFPAAEAARSSTPGTT